MKLISKLTYVSLITLFLLVSCNEYKDVKDRGYKGRPDIALTYPELISMLQHYDNTKKDLQPKVNGGEDARIQFLEIEKLKAYIAYIEKESKKKKIKLTGINFISAAYPENHVDKKKRNYQTLIMMPATTIGDEEGVSFDPLKSERGVPKSLKEILAGYNGYLWYYDKLSINTTKSRSMSRSAKSSSGGDDLSAGGNRMRPSPPH
ncbi:MAG: hypothetical protein JXR05_15720 [Flavobacteriaceae bacterium]